MKYFLAIVLFIIHTQISLAQAASDSPYSGQKFDPAANEAWYSSPLFLAGVALVAVIGYLFFTKKR